MVAGQYQGLRPGMTPALTVLQLDTRFPRVPGDVACPDTYLNDVEILRIPAASVGRIVTGDPATVYIGPFEVAVGMARGNVIATSCGFLAHWQRHLQALTNKPFVASALTALTRLKTDDEPVSVLTFDGPKLEEGHSDVLAGQTQQVIGLRPEMHLRQVIEQDVTDLDQQLAAAEIGALVKDRLDPDCKTLLLECTNLPPYKTTIGGVFKGQIVDILTEIERLRPGTVQPAFL